MTNLFIDCEWFLNQKIFLIGYAYAIKDFGQLYDRSLTKANFYKILKPVDGYIFFYGPDIAMVEKYFNIDLRHNYKCINLIRIFRNFEKGLDSYKLSEMEKHYGIERSTSIYKTDIFKLFYDWYDPVKKHIALQYNKEDVLNLIRVKHKVFSAHQITPAKLKNYLLQ